jgi:A/G-specific adenine glycosylase
MPWRRTRGPYAIWVSEVMLQQTQVATVKPYFERFMARFTTPRALASAELGDVLKVWEGLGYYSRARNLHRAAQTICREHGGRLPSAEKELLKIPGIGPYTAGAIASIAFDRPVPAVDGNVARVLCRLFLVRRDARQARTHRRLREHIEPLLRLGRPGAVNQALMDLGATLCKPADPDCPQCPLARFCGAQCTGVQAKFPRRAKRPKVPHYDVVAGIIWRRGCVLIDQRPAEGLLGGLWEFPGGKVQPGETPQIALAREVREELGVKIRVGPLLETVRHAYSHFRITLRFHDARYVSGRTRALGCAAFRWVRPGQLGRYAFPRANRSMVQRLIRQAACRRQ